MTTGARLKPSPGAAFATSFRAQLRRFVRGKKLVLALVAVVLMIGVAALAINLAGAGDDLTTELQHEKTKEAMSDAIKFGYFFFLCYLVPFLFGTGVVAEEVQARTFTFLASRPAPRASIVLGKLIASVVASCSLLGLSLVLLHLLGFASEPVLLAEELPTTLRRAAGVMMLGAQYTAACVLLGSLFPRWPAMSATLYIAFFEFVMAMTPGYLRFVALNHQGRMVAGVGPANILARTIPEIPLYGSIAALVLAFAVTSTLAIAAVSAREYNEGQG